MEKTIKCPKCGREMVQEDPYLHIKDEGEGVIGPYKNIYRCSDFTCTGVKIIGNWPHSS